jgi:hypothetical protein
MGRRPPGGLVVDADEGDRSSSEGAGDDMHDRHALPAATALHCRPDQRAVRDRKDQARARHVRRADVAGDLLRVHLLRKAAGARRPADPAWPRSARTPWRGAGRRSSRGAPSARRCAAGRGAPRAACADSSGCARLSTTFSASSGRTPPRPFSTRSTVAVPTPAWRAMSLIARTCSSYRGLLEPIPACHGSVRPPSTTV